MGNTPTAAEFSDPNYGDFLEKVKESKCQVYSPQRSIWRYFIYGNEKSEHPVVFLPSTTCVPEVFHRQFLDLPARGYKLVSVHYPAFETIEEFGRGFAAFLDYEYIGGIHLVGCGVAGLLAQVFCAQYPKRVLSLFLCNSYSDNEMFNMNRTEYYYSPLLVLKDNLLANLPSGDVESEIANSVIFVSEHFDQLTRDQVVSRIGFTANHIAIKKPPIPPQHVTFLYCADTEVVPEVLQKKTLEIYPNAHHVTLKTGGDFPFFSRYEEFNLHLTVHLRRNADWGGIATNAAGERVWISKDPTEDNAPGGGKDSDASSSSSSSASTPSSSNISSASTSFSGTSHKSGFEEDENEDAEENEVL